MILEINEIEQLHLLGIVTYAGLKKARIINRFFRLREKGIPKMDCYIRISDEFHTDDTYIRKIVNNYNAKLEVREA